MRKYRIYHPLFMAFYSKRLYRDVCFHWPGMGFQFLGLLVMVVALAKGAALFSVVYGASGDIKAELEKTNPTVTITDGKASMAPEGPIRISHPYLDGDFIILDPEGGTEMPTDMAMGIYLAKEKLFMKLGEGRELEYNLSDFNEETGSKEIVITTADIEEYLDAYVIFIMPVAVTFGFMLLYFMYSITVFGLGMVGLVFSKVWKADPPYTVLLRLAAVSMVPAGILDAALSLAHHQVLHFELVKLILAIVYMNVAVKWCYAAEKPTEESQQGD